VVFDGEDVLTFDEKELQGVRGAKISYIFQEPSTSLNPVFTIGDQIRETVMLHRGMDKKSALGFSEGLLETVGMPAPKQRLSAYPHELSGGMKQRVMIAMAIASGPALLVADEPTTALDVTIQAQILALLDDLRKTKALSVLLITHDLSIVGQIADKVAIMYMGRIVEYAPLADIMNNPLHPYTIGLMSCVPKPGEAKERLVSIKGNVPDAGRIPQGCRFNPRCKLADDSCRKAEPELAEVKPGHFVRCIKCRC
ncbi:MAG: ABC transporter ATP-binding protein, partial [Candidatus Omnitrophota bacterium]